MQLFPPNDETIAGAGQAIREGRRSCLDVLESCLTKIDEWEPKVNAWVVVDRDGAREQAKQLDDDLKADKDRGPLHGIPIGIKDIIDVEGLPTACGSRLWKDKIAENDAELVLCLREAGAVILGKTVTTAYAWVDPPVTRNPWDLERTPGGSSSGSAAAVATGMCLGAIGSQTGGSIIRPASFCGVAGCKPSYGEISTAGVFPFAKSLDHPGPLARTVTDLAFLLNAVRKRPFFSLMASRLGAGVERSRDLEDFVSRRFLGPSQVDPAGEEMPRIGRLGGMFQERAEPAMREAVDRAIGAFLMAGAEVCSVAPPEAFSELIAVHRTIMAAEAAALHQVRFAESPEDYPPRIGELIREGLAIPAVEYLRCRRRQDNLAVAVDALFERSDVLLAPATVGPAPDPGTTGDPVFNSPWSLVGFPAITFPVGLSPEGLPLGVQLIGRWRGETGLFRAARWCEGAARRAYYSQE